MNLLSLIDALTLIAIIAGPMLGVYLTRSIDEKREKRSRQYAVFSDLMKTRRARMDPNHIAALNLVELEFYGDKLILDSYKNYTDHLNSNWPSDQNELQRHIDRGDDLFAELLTSIAKSMGFQFDKRDLERRGYLPVGLGNANVNQLANIQLLRDVLEGRRPIFVANASQVKPDETDSVPVIDEHFDLKPR